eukprot:TRINITY_DN432_c0_g1_i3.p1 TRINITY_DN432_c0_g1~~TRINITY_DN432_c0_g1_i3.p1  ORF type:complete len:206 (-),score=53.57 TRINITY_DN432_c0_g1_i3:106-723(-)
MQLQSAIKNAPGTSHHKKKQSQGEQNLRAAGVCLMLVLFSCGLFLNSPNSQKKISLLQNPSQFVHPALPKSEKLSDIETQHLIKDGNQKNQPEEEESPKSSNKKNKSHKRIREDENMNQAKRQCIESEMIYQEVIDNHSKVHLSSGETKISNESIVTVILPAGEDAGSPSKPELSPSPSRSPEFYPVYVSDQEISNHPLKELEVD